MATKTSGEVATSLSAIAPNGKHIYVQFHASNALSIAGVRIKANQDFILKINETGQNPQVITFPDKIVFRFKNLAIAKDGTIYISATTDGFTSTSGKKYYPAPKESSSFGVLLRVSPQGKWNGVVKIGEKKQSSFDHIQVDGQGHLYIAGDGRNDDTFGDLRFKHTRKGKAYENFLWRIESIQWDTP